MSQRLYIARNRVQEISDLAEWVAGNQIPVDPVAVLRDQAGITLIRGDFGDAFDGLLEWRDGRFWVYSNLKRVGLPGSTRERFTIAHELGHFFLDEHRNALISGVGRHASLSEFQSDELAEREADLFASRLLMPTPAFNAALSKNPTGIFEIRALSQRFDTSITSTAIRYVSLADFFCVVVKWNADGYGWSWKSPIASANKYWRAKKSADKLPRDSATRMAMQMAPSSSAEPIQRGAVASMWFDFVGKGGPRDEILIEQAIALGRYGFLTLLLPDSMGGE